ncbi:Glutamine transport ATP-binding protein GlnQ [Pelotomaculum propionicicum]|uniref:Glutamine transport ATP-binding protein GlnQ n=1 Tax=Pelotomaculum propionicicum TaxID=258475 RepID=A0A4Y7RL70_9FIRM|nr:Glutamine transport ATP-binding protein GlnQ [Pelotomaculum propionicicum]
MAGQEVVVVIGPSGSGKSTFLRCLNYLEEPTSGEIVIDGINLTAKDSVSNKVRMEVGMVFQRFNLHCYTFTVGKTKQAGGCRSGWGYHHGYHPAADSQVYRRRYCRNRGDQRYCSVRAGAASNTAADNILTLIFGRFAQAVFIIW